MRKVAWFACVIVVSGGCRIGFDDVPSVGSDAARDAAIDHTCDPEAPFGAPVPIAELDEPGTEGTLRLLPDERRGYFWAFRNGTDSDIYVATRPDLDTPFTVAPVASVNSPDNEIDPTVSDDDQVMVLRRNPRTGAGDELYASGRATAADFAEPELIPTLSSLASEQQPFLQPGGDLMIFSRNDGSNPHDLYRTTRTGSTFSDPARIDELESTTSDEGDPVLTGDGLALYFFSSRPDPSFASNNIYVATRASTADLFGAPTIVENVNSDGRDGPSWLSPDGCRLYLSSDRTGSNTIYVATRGH